MRSSQHRYHVALLGWIVAVLALPVASGQDMATLEVKGRGVEGRTPYRGGGVVRFLDASLDAQLVHFTGEGEVPLPLAIRYDVREAAPILLTSRLGSEHFHLYHFALETVSEMYADQKINLVRQMSIHGYCLFAYTYLDDAILTLLRDSVNAEPAVPVFR